MTNIGNGSGLNRALGKFCSYLAFLMFCAAAHAGASSDTGVLTMFYVDASGSVAIQLDGGFPGAVAAGQCATYNGAAGNTTADPALKATLLTAKATGQTIQIITQGCDAGGAWLKVVAAYLR